MDGLPGVPPMRNRMDMMILDGSFLGGKGFYSMVRTSAVSCMGWVI